MNVKCVKKRTTWGRRCGKGATDVSRTYEDGVKNDDSKRTQNIKSRAEGRKGEHEAIYPFLRGNCRSMASLPVATPVPGTSQVAPPPHEIQLETQSINGGSVGWIMEMIDWGQGTRRVDVARCGLVSNKFRGWVKKEEMLTERMECDLIGYLRVK